MSVLRTIVNGLFVSLQFFLPQHMISRAMGFLADCKIPWVANTMIHFFQSTFKIDLMECQQSSIKAFPSFNAFFIRALTPQARPIAASEKACVSPCDGTILSIGSVVNGDHFTIKSHRYSLASLLLTGNQRLVSARMLQGAVIYLSPSDYHRVHMPVSGRLISMQFVPGRLFSVNHTTSDAIPDLFARNERLICHFDTVFGPMVVVMIGAMIVGSMVVVWEGVINPGRSQVTHYDYENKEIVLKKGDEMGYFKMGSTVAVFMDQVACVSGWKKGNTIKMGQALFEA